MILPSSVMIACVFVNLTSHPASHSTGTDRRDLTIDGNTCAILAFRGTPGMCNNFVADDVMGWLLAQSAVIGWCGMRVPGKSSVIKWPVAAESGWRLGLLFNMRAMIVFACS